MSTENSHNYATHPCGINPSLTSQAPILSTIHYTSPTTQLTPSIKPWPILHPTTSSNPSSFNHSALPISTALVILFGVNPSNLVSQGHILHPPFNRQPPSTLRQGSPAPHSTILPYSSLQHQSPQLASVHQLWLPKFSFVQVTHAAYASCTNLGTMAVFREYGSGLLNEWLDSLFIPRNVENLQQVKEIWEVSNVSCPPLYEWAVVMRNYRSKTGKKLFHVQPTQMYTQFI